VIVVIVHSHRRALGADTAPGEGIVREIVNEIDDV